MMDDQSDEKVSSCIIYINSLIYFNNFVDPPNTLLCCPLLICLTIMGMGLEKVVAPMSEAVSMAKDKEVRGR